MTNTQAKKKCHRRPIASQRPPGSVSHDGNPRSVHTPRESRDRPNTPVVSKSRPKTRVTPSGSPFGAGLAVMRSSGGSPEYEDLPQYRFA